MTGRTFGGKPIVRPQVRIGIENNMPCYQIWMRDQLDWMPEFKNRFRWHSFAYVFAIRPEQIGIEALKHLDQSKVFNTEIQQ